MKSVSSILLLLCYHQVNGFSIQQPIPSISSLRNPNTSPMILQSSSNPEDTVDLPSKRKLIMKRIQSFGELIQKRSDTMRSAGFYEDETELEPLMAGYKTNISIFVACMLYKWYRSIFINKVRIALEFPIAIVYLSAYFFTHNCLVFCYRWRFGNVNHNGIQ